MEVEMFLLGVAIGIVLRNIVKIGSMAYDVLFQTNKRKVLAREKRIDEAQSAIANAKKETNVGRKMKLVQQIPSVFSVRTSSGGGPFSAACGIELVDGFSVYFNSDDQVYAINKAINAITEEVTRKVGFDG